MMEKCTAFVLGGGGSHGALQVGAMRAFLEAGIAPDLLVGTSIGAVNAAGMALWGVDEQGVESLANAWGKVADAQLLDSRVSQLIVRAMLGRPSDRARQKAEDFFVSHGFSRGLRFSMIHGVKLALISADIETGQPIIYGKNPEDSILEGLLTSIAIPPWFVPFSKEGQIIMDGGALSNLPIEPAVQMGAMEIFAFDLDDSSTIPSENLSISQYLQKYVHAVSRRHVMLETAYAEAQGVPVHRMNFTGLANMPIYDFSKYQPLVEAGYQRARQQLAEWNEETQQEPGLVILRDEELAMKKHSTE